MEARSTRLYFIDAMRAWAILMMLQGHFVDGLLDPAYRDPSNLVYGTWNYFRGITAPVFFTVSGFIFTYLILRSPIQGLQNPRILKGLRRGAQLVAVGYLLRLNVLGLLNGVVYPSFFLVDVLHCIGFALIFLVGIYAAIPRGKTGLLAMALLASGLLLFLFEPIYKSWDLTFLPAALANYFTRANGSVFTLVPWIGYSAIGGALASVFYRLRNSGSLYPGSIGVFLLAGFGLIWYASPFFLWLAELTGISLFDQIVANNYLFMRLGDVLLVFAVFLMLRSLMTRTIFLSIGQNTLSIYVIHFIVLYGSFTGMGLYRYWDHQLSPVAAVSGALIFMGFCTWAALVYSTHRGRIQKALYLDPVRARTSLNGLLGHGWRLSREFRLRLYRYFSTVLQDR
jgi:uncharacterized membrane protein